jgi:hypothetical protein
MRAERSLISAVIGMGLSAGFALVFLLTAMYFHDYGGFLAFLAVFSSALLTVVSVVMFAVLAGAYCLVLLRQPDDVSPAGMEEGSIYRDVKHGAVVYQNVKALSGIGAVVYYPDQPAPRMRHEPSAVRDNGHDVYEIPELEIFDESFEERFGEKERRYVQ